MRKCGPDDGGTILRMPNIATVLKAEIGRVARKELRAETDGLKKNVSGQRAEIAALKRRIQDLEKAFKTLSKGASAKATTVPVSNEPAGPLRFKAAGMAANRKRLGISAAEFRLLVGASGQSVYLWESGKGKPRGKFLQAIAELRGLGKREVAARLAALKQS